MGEQICKKCKHEREPDRFGRYLKRNKFIRGLCSVCYRTSKADGTFESMANEPGNHPHKREMWSVVEHPIGYTTIKTPDGIIHEHRYVMERSLGRKLVPGESVHHLNGKRSDNRIENLELWFTVQPAGQRIEELLDYVASFHADEILEVLSKRALTGR